MDNLIVFVMGFVFIASYLIDLNDSFKRFLKENNKRGF